VITHSIVGEHILLYQNTFYGRRIHSLVTTFQHQKKKNSVTCNPRCVVCMYAHIRKPTNTPPPLLHVRAYASASRESVMRGTYIPTHTQTTNTARARTRTHAHARARTRTHAHARARTHTRTEFLADRGYICFACGTTWPLGMEQVPHVLLQNVFSYYRMCSLTTECVLLHVVQLGLWAWSRCHMSCREVGGGGGGLPLRGVWVYECGPKA